MYCTSNGNRIKAYRKMLNISQKEVAGNSLSHSMISLIESGKIEMTTVTAIILADNLNRIAAEKGIKLNLGLKDMLISDEEHFKDLCERMLEQLKDTKFDEEKYNEIYKLAADNNLYRTMALIKEKIGDEKVSLKDYSAALQNYIECKEIYDDLQDSCASEGILNKLSECCCRIEALDNAEELLEESIQIWNKQHKDKPFPNVEVLYSLSKIKLHENKFHEASNYIDLCINIKEISEEQLYRALTLKADIYLNSGSYEEAITVYSDYLKKIEISKLHKEKERFQCYKCIYEICEKMGRVTVYSEYEHKIRDILDSDIEEKYRLNYVFLLVRYYLKTGQLKTADETISKYENKPWKAG